MAATLPLHLSLRSDFGEPSVQAEQMRARAFRHESPLDLTMTSPTEAGLTLPNFSAELGQASGAYRPDPLGLLSAREALARAYRPRADIRANDLLLTASTSEAYSFVLHALCDPGDAVLVPEPSYPLFDQLAQLAGVRLLRFPIAYDGSFHIDLGALPSTSELAAERVRAVFCVSPNNPTGNSLTREELARLRALGLPLVVDEVFRGYDGQASVAMADPLSDDNAGLTIILDGLSKRLGAPGLKLGWMLLRGVGRAQVQARLEWVSDSFLSPNAAVQERLPALLKWEESARGTIQERLTINRRCLADHRWKHAGISVLRVNAGWTALIRLPTIRNQDDWWLALSEAGLWVHPGELYRLTLTSVFTISLLTPPDTLSEAMIRLAALIESPEEF